MRYSTYFLPKLPNSTDPILDYDVSISNNLKNNERCVKGLENIDNLVSYDPQVKLHIFEYGEPH